MLVNVIKDIIKTALLFEMEDGNVKRLIYQPYLCKHLIGKTIDYKKDLVDILVKTKFNELFGVCEKDFEEIINRLPFNKKIIFDYKNKVIEHD